MESILIELLSERWQELLLFVLAVCKTGIIQVKICGPLSLQNVARSF
jgi:hypothetical protein